MSAGTLQRRPADGKVQRDPSAGKVRRNSATNNRCCCVECGTPCDLCSGCTPLRVTVTLSGTTVRNSCFFYNGPNLGGSILDPPVLTPDQVALATPYAPCGTEDPGGGQNQSILDGTVVLTQDPTTPCIWWYAEIVTWFHGYFTQSLPGDPYYQCGEKMCTQPAQQVIYLLDPVGGQFNVWITWDLTPYSYGGGPNLNYSHWLFASGFPTACPGGQVTNGQSPTDVYPGPPSFPVPSNPLLGYLPVPTAATTFADISVPPFSYGYGGTASFTAGP